MINIDTIDLFDQATWSLISSGHTTGLFQIESDLGRKTCRDIKPQSIEELSDIIALIRPGCLQAFMADGKNVTEHYTMRVKGLEPINYFHDSLKDILKPTKGLLIYQEQAMRIAQELAGFTGAEADTKIRKVLAKKRSDLIEAAKKDFLKGAAKLGVVKEDEAEQIFSWIQAGQRYSFNKCISAYAQVKTKKMGIRSLYQVQKGDEVLAPTGKGNGTHYVTVKDVIHNGKMKSVWICTKDRATICTMDHKFMTADGEMETVADLLNTRHDLLQDDGTYSQIVDFKILDHTCTMMDLEVDSDLHVFFADGLVSSNSHSVSYAETSYKTAYIKAHWPERFFVSWMNHAKDFDQVRKLTYDSTNFKVTIAPPDIRKKNRDFAFLDSKVYYGIGHIKGMGEKGFDKLDPYLENLSDKSWSDILFNILIYQNKIAAKAIIGSGALDFLKMSRNKMLFDHNIVLMLTKKEQKFIRDKCKLDKPLKDIIFYICNLGAGRDYAVSNKTRMAKVRSLIGILENPPESLSDDESHICAQEETLLGVSMTGSKTRKYGFVNSSTCKDFNEDRIPPKEIKIIAQIMEIKPFITKKADEMAFLRIADDTDEINNGVMFDSWYHYKNVLEEGDVAFFKGMKGKNGGFVINKVEIL